MGQGLVSRDPAEKNDTDESEVLPWVPGGPWLSYVWLSGPPLPREHTWMAVIQSLLESHLSHCDVKAISRDSISDCLLPQMIITPLSMRQSLKGKKIGTDNNCGKL